MPEELENLDYSPEGVVVEAMRQGRRSISQRANVDSAARAYLESGLTDGSSPGIAFTSYSLGEILNLDRMTPFGSLQFWLPLIR